MNLGKTILKTIKRLGVKSKDITELLDGLGLDSIINEFLKESAKKNNEKELIFLGYQKEDLFIMQPFAIKTIEINGLKYQVIANSYSIHLFGQEYKEIQLKDLINNLIEIAFKEGK